MYIHIFEYIYIYIYICIYVSVNIYIYMYIYMCNHPPDSGLTDMQLRNCQEASWATLG